jgi:hypothetical protein
LVIFFEEIFFLIGIILVIFLRKFAVLIQHFAVIIVFFCK